MSCETCKHLNYCGYSADLADLAWTVACKAHLLTLLNPEIDLGSKDIEAIGCLALEMAQQLQLLQTKLENL